MNQRILMSIIPYQAIWLENKRGGTGLIMGQLWRVYSSQISIMFGNREFCLDKGLGQRMVHVNLPTFSILLSSLYSGYVAYLPVPSSAWIAHEKCVSVLPVFPVLLLRAENGS